MGHPGAGGRFCGWFCGELGASALEPLARPKNGQIALDGVGGPRAHDVLVRGHELEAASLPSRRSTSSDPIGLYARKSDASPCDRASPSPWRAIRRPSPGRDRTTPCSGARATVARAHGRFSQAPLAVQRHKAVRTRVLGFEGRDARRCLRWWTVGMPPRWRGVRKVARHANVRNPSRRPGQNASPRKICGIFRGFVWPDP
jgi:hypothetical protein